MNFTSGNITNHILKMSGSITISLLFIYSIGLVDVYLLSRLDNQAILAGLGTASAVLLMLLSMSTAIAHTAGILIAQEIGRYNITQAKRLFSNTLFFGFILTTSFSIATFFSLEYVVKIFWLSDEASNIFTKYLTFIIPSNFLVTLFLTTNFVSRSLGDYKSPMKYTILSAITNILLSYIFIAIMNLGLDGAIISGTLTRFLGPLLMLSKIMKSQPDFNFKLADISKQEQKKITHYFIPIAISNIITPFSSIFMMYVLSKYGDSITAGYTVATRIFNFVFCIIVALPGAISSIVGQNYGAKKFKRITKTLRSSTIISAIYTFIFSFILFLLKEEIAMFFSLTGESAQFLTYFMTFIPIFSFFHCIFTISTGTLNSVGKPKISTAIMFIKVFVFTIPFILLSSFLGDANDVLISEAIAAVFSAFISLYIAYREVNNLSSSRI